MAKRAKKAKITYEPEADVLMAEISNEPIDYAKEVGSFIVHFTKKDNPVLIEVLEASRFMATAKNLFARGLRSERKVSTVMN